VSVHKAAERFIAAIGEPERKKLAQGLVNDLPNYPEVLDRWDIEKIRGTENMYRVRIGRYRIVFVVDKKTRNIEVPDAFMK
jgi:mRNA-degrading endonuclease RelE of RelBE toxin-antitoxin system